MFVDTEYYRSSGEKKYGVGIRFSTNRSLLCSEDIYATPTYRGEDKCSMYQLRSSDTLVDNRSTHVQQSTVGTKRSVIHT